MNLFILLALGYALLVLLLSLSGRLSLLQRLGLLAVGSLFILLHHYGLKELLGQPSQAQLPQRFEILATEIQEQEDRVYLWIREQPEDAPRAYVMPLKKEQLPVLDQARETNGKGRIAIAEREESGNGLRLLPSRERTLPPKSANRP